MVKSSKNNGADKMNTLRIGTNPDLSCEEVAIRAFLTMQAHNVSLQHWVTGLNVKQITKTKTQRGNKLNTAQLEEVTKKHIESPVDRAQSALAALRATESLIGQIGQLENNGSDLAILLSLIIENLDDAIEDMYQQLRQIKANALKGGVA